MYPVLYHSMRHEKNTNVDPTCRRLRRLRQTPTNLPSSQPVSSVSLLLLSSSPPLLLSFLPLLLSFLLRTPIPYLHIITLGEEGAADSSTSVSVYPQGVLLANSWIHIEVGDPDVHSVSRCPSGADGGGVGEAGNGGDPRQTWRVTSALAGVSNVVSKPPRALRTAETVEGR